MLRMCCISRLSIEPRKMRLSVIRSRGCFHPNSAVPSRRLPFCSVLLRSPQRNPKAPKSEIRTKTEPRNPKRSLILNERGAGRPMFGLRASELFGFRPADLPYPLRSRIDVKISVTTSDAGFVPTLPLPCNLTATVSCSNSFCPKTNIVWTRDCSASAIFALIGLSL